MSTNQTVSLQAVTSQSYRLNFPVLISSLNSLGVTHLQRWLGNPSRSHVADLQFERLVVGHEIEVDAVGYQSASELSLNLVHVLKHTEVNSNIARKVSQTVNFVVVSFCLWSELVDLIDLIVRKEKSILRSEFVWHFGHNWLREEKQKAQMFVILWINLLIFPTSRAYRICSA